ncbi:MAG: hypothetical protein WAM96_15035 [Candidatus Acidiferrales bacterium]
MSVILNERESGSREAKQEQSSNSERRLWMAVLLQAVQDWQSHNIRAQREAEDFFFHSTEDFERVCHGAGMDPATLQSKLKRLCRTQTGYPLARLVYAS